MSETRVNEDEQPISGAGFDGSPRQLHAKDFGCRLPDSRHCNQRQLVLLETLAQLEKASPTARYHRLARQNVKRWWQQAQQTQQSQQATCRVLVLPGDWGEVTHALTKEYGHIFASLNMANAYGPGGGYTHGMIAQEENMFRRTDCHFALDHRDQDGEMYKDTMTAVRRTASIARSILTSHQRFIVLLSWVLQLLNAAEGRVYLDTTHPRVCIRGAEDRSRADYGYAWLADEEVFPFMELRAAAVDLRMGGRFDSAETVISHLINILISIDCLHGRPFRPGSRSR